MMKIQTTSKETVVLHSHWVLKNMISKKLYAVLTSLALFVTSYAQDGTGKIDKIFNWAIPTTPGCVCAVSQNGKLVTNRAYGSADLERNVPLSTVSVFDAASLRKQFVAAAVLLRTMFVSTFRNYPITATRSRSTICSRIPAAFGTGSRF
jgi:hypothetical protein